MVAVVEEEVIAMVVAVDEAGMAEEEAVMDRNTMVGEEATMATTTGQMT